MNGDELRRVLRDEADRVEIGEQSWSRLEPRLSGDRSASGARSFALGAVAIAVVVALVAGVLWFGRDEHDTHVAAGVQSSMPSRIVAWTRHDELVVLDSRTGRLVRTLVGDVATGFRGSPALSVTSDGANLYYTDAVPKEDGPGCPGAPNFVMRIPIAGGTPIEVRRGRTAAISPTGEMFASSLDSGLCSSGGGVLNVGPIGGAAAGLGSGDVADELVLYHLSWAPDGRHLAFQWLKGTSYAYVLDTKTATSMNEAACVCKQSDAVGWFGYFGDTGEFLGSRTPHGKPTAFEKVRFGRSQVVALRADGSARRTLFAVRGQVEDLASDRGGDHVLAVAAEGGRKFSLSRWSRGDKKPTKIRGGIIAAAWIPDAPTTAPVPSVAVARTGGRLQVWLTPTGEEVRELTVLPDVSPQIAAVPNGDGIVAGVNFAGPCGQPNDPAVERVDLADGTTERVASGRYPVVSVNGLVAYEIRCDGITLGTTDLASGASTRSNPIGDSASETSPRVQRVLPVAFSPDGTQLLYAVGVRGAGERWYVARVSAEGFLDHRPRRLPSAVGTKWTFLDDRHLAAAFSRFPDTVVRTVTLPRRRSGRVQVGAPMIRFRGSVIRMSADPSGRWFLAVLRGGVLVSWRRDGRRVGRVVGNVESAAWLPSR